uniref:Uncharacterized protein n=1 Tax=Magallana gigas TaxID=29159 RepID=K1RRZ2_MAGGI
MGDYDVSIRLLEYTRDQNCSCDSGLWGCHECDVYFQICLQPLSPTQGQICQGNNQDDRVDDTHHFLFASALRGHDTYTWSNVNGQPTFQISVHAFDYDKWNGNDDLGVTSYTYRGNIPPVLTVTTNPGHKNMSHNTSTKNNDNKHIFNIEKIIFNNTSKNNNYSPTNSIFQYGQSSTKIQIVYNYTQCNHTDDWIKDKVRLALQIMNLTLYQEKTIGKNTIANFKTAVGDYDVSVRLLEYTRDQDCGCDGGLWGCHECDVFFQICLQPLSPTQGQMCQGNNQDDRVDDTHHFLFAGALRGHDTYTWRNVNGQPTFQISVHVFDYDTLGGNDNLGVTSYNYRGNRPTVQNVITSPGNKNMREPITKILYTYSCTQCDLEDDQVKDSVKSALQTFNLKEYQAETTDKKVVNSDKNNTGLLVGVVAAILLVLVITSVGVWHYKRKMHKRSKVKEMELEMNGHTNRALNIGDSEDVATFRNPDYNSNRSMKTPLSKQMASPSVTLHLNGS